QGGIVFDVKNEYTHRLPVSFTSKALIVVPIDTNVDSSPLIFGVDRLTLSSFYVTARRVSGITNLWFRYIAIGI
ncbi:hypothetical protein, partial [Veillonella magna]|uniref:hypothetical protein n=1 Tax=Veillonella magna TaxID=464322 RepID=UPI001961E939